MSLPHCPLPSPSLTSWCWGRISPHSDDEADRGDEAPPGCDAPVVRPDGVPGSPLQQQPEAEEDWEDAEAPGQGAGRAADPLAEEWEMQLEVQAISRLRIYPFSPPALPCVPETARPDRSRGSPQVGAGKKGASSANDASQSQNAPATGTEAAKPRKPARNDSRKP